MQVLVDTNPYIHFQEIMTRSSTLSPSDMPPAETNHNQLSTFPRPCLVPGKVESVRRSFPVLNGFACVFCNNSVRDNFMYLQMLELNCVVTTCWIRLKDQKITLTQNHGSWVNLALSSKSRNRPFAGSAPGWQLSLLSVGGWLTTGRPLVTCCLCWKSIHDSTWLVIHIRYAFRTEYTSSGSEYTTFKQNTHWISFNDQFSQKTIIIESM